MNETKLGFIEARFADIIWNNAPITTRKLIEICEKELNWKRTTTYTVLKKLCEKGLFKTEKSTVFVLISRDDFYAIQSEKFVDEVFKGSLPAFIAAFTLHKSPTAEELKEIKHIMSSFEEE